MFLRDCPTTKVLVRAEYLYNHERGHGTYVEGYLFAVTSLANRPLLFTVHLQSGAVISRLPLDALCTKPCEKWPLHDLELWSALSNTITVLQHEYLKRYSMQVRVNDMSYGATYLFTIDSCGEGFAESPDQHKTFNIAQLDTGHLVAQPNNRCLFLDSHFVDRQLPLDYLTNTQEWLCEDLAALGAETKWAY